MPASHTSTADRKLVARVDAVNPAEIVVCSVVKAELYYGAVKSVNPVGSRTFQEAFLARFASLPFDDRAAEAYAQIRGDVQPRVLMIGFNDLLIAAIALANDVVLVTHNTTEFSRVKHLRLVDWE